PLLLPKPLPRLAPDVGIRNRGIPPERARSANHFRPLIHSLTPSGERGADAFGQADPHVSRLPAAQPCSINVDVLGFHPQSPCRFRVPLRPNYLPKSRRLSTICTKKSQWNGLDTAIFTGRLRPKRRT